MAVHFQRLVLLFWFVLAKSSRRRFGRLLWGDYAPSIGHAHKPLHLMCAERLKESDGEKGGGRKKWWEGEKKEGRPPHCLTWAFLVKLWTSQAHMSQSLGWCSPLNFSSSFFIVVPRCIIATAEDKKSFFFFSFSYGGIWEIFQIFAFYLNMFFD